MKILYDHQIFSRQTYGGISRYFTQLFKHFPSEVNVEIGLKYSDNAYLDKGLVADLECYKDPYFDFLPKYSFKGKRRFFKFKKRLYNENYCSDPLAENKRRVIELLKRQEFDIFHPTYYDSYFLEYIGNKPFVLTIHDMIHEIFPEMMYEPKLLIEKALLAKEAKHIIAVSQNTKKDIIDIFKLPSDKISVVYHANSLERMEKRNIDIPEKYLLYVGDRKYYKNFLFFAHAIHVLLAKHNDLYVLCVGNSFDKDETEFLRRKNILDKFCTVEASDEILASLYKNALAFIYPSYYEGFGIPILEAFAFKCPVILSDSSCFREIAHDASEYFDPKNVNSIVTTIERVITTPKLKESLIGKGIKRLGDFSWNESALQTAKVYKDILVDS